MGWKGNVLLKAKDIKQFKKRYYGRIGRLVAVKVEVAGDNNFGWG